MCRLSEINKELICKALDIAWHHANNVSNLQELKGKKVELVELQNELAKLESQIKGSQEVWLIESKSN